MIKKIVSVSNATKRKCKEINGEGDGLPLAKQQKVCTPNSNSR